MSEPKQPNAFEQMTQGGAYKVQGSEDLQRVTFSPQGLQFEVVAAPDKVREHMAVGGYQIPPDAKDKALRQIAAMVKDGLIFPEFTRPQQAQQALAESHTVGDLPQSAPPTPGFAQRLLAKRAASQEQGIGGRA